MEHAKRPWLSLIVLCLGTFAVLLDATIVNVALPSVLTGLHASLDQALWVVNAYLLVFAALLIFASRLGDMFGPRRLFTVGLALFATASALCGASQAPGELIAGGRRPGHLGLPQARQTSSCRASHPGGTGEMIGGRPMVLKGSA